MNVSDLVRDYLEPLRKASAAAPVLDLACGSGRNGLWLVSRGIPVVFADIRQEALDGVRARVSPDRDHLAGFWQVDFEAAESGLLEPAAFGAVLVFRYLHRPLMVDIKRAVVPGGIVIYETFTTGQAAIGRPTNPDFLLRPGELRDYFCDWPVVHCFEGEVRDPESGRRQAIAQLVARRPLTAVPIPAAV